MLFSSFAELLLTGAFGSLRALRPGADVCGKSEKLFSLFLGILLQLLPLALQGPSPIQLVLLLEQLLLDGVLAQKRSQPLVQLTFQLLQPVAHGLVPGVVITGFSISACRGSIAAVFELRII